MKCCSLILYLFKLSHLESKWPKICGAALFEMEKRVCNVSFHQISRVIHGDLVSASATLAVFFII